MVPASVRGLKLTDGGDQASSQGPFVHAAVGPPFTWTPDSLLPVWCPTVQLAHRGVCVMAGASGLRRDRDLVTLMSRGS